MPRLEQFTTQLATLEAELSAFPPVSEMDAEEVQGVSALRSALPRMIQFLRQKMVRFNRLPPKGENKTARRCRITIDCRQSEAAHRS